MKYLSLLLCALAVLFGSCKSSKKEAVETPASRTVVIYMAATNSLGDGSAVGNPDGTARWQHAADSLNIEQICDAAARGAIGSGRVILYHSDNAGKATLYEVTKKGELKALRSYTDGATSVEASRMSAVLDDAINFAPAYAYGLVLWSHGDGWLENGIQPQASSLKPQEVSVPQEQAFGTERGKKMNVTTLAGILRDHGFEYVYFDCCYMATVEVAYELRHCTALIVGSPTVLPFDGMPYDRNLALLVDGSEEALVRAATNTFSHYDALTGPARTCTMTVVRTRWLDALADATRSLYSKAEKRWPDGYKPQSMALAERLYYDFAHYADALGADEAWHAALDRCIAYRSATPMLWDKLPLTDVCGLSTFIMRYNGDEAYRNYDRLAWYKDVASALTPAH